MIVRIATKTMLNPRCLAEEEGVGLDVSEHGMTAYPPGWVLDNPAGIPLTPAGIPVPVAAGMPAPAVPAVEQS